MDKPAEKRSLTVSVQSMDAGSWIERKLPKLLCMMPIVLASVSTHATDLHWNTVDHQPDGLATYVENMRTFAVFESVPKGAPSMHRMGDAIEIDRDLLRVIFRQAQFNIPDGLDVYTENFNEAAGSDRPLAGR